jgi:hypothetical protein
MEIEMDESNVRTIFTNERTSAGPTTRWGCNTCSKLEVRSQAALSRTLGMRKARYCKSGQSAHGGATHDASRNRSSGVI